MPFDVKLIELLSKEAGVYLMKSASGDVLYVGKANNLKRRVKQYFSLSSDTRPMIPFLISQVETIETIIVSSEKEALLLENTLIKEYQPHYNALLKDDKSYIALKMDLSKEWPLVELVRYRGTSKESGLFFGPFTSAHKARETLDFIQRVFPLRQCSDQEFLRRTRPCILYDMKRCIAPCVGRCTKEEYDTVAKNVVKFLRGQDREILDDLKKKMKEASEQLEFEKAQTLLNQIRAIEKTLEEQHVDKPFGEDTDAIGLFRKGDQVSIANLVWKHGRFLGLKSYFFSENVQEEEEILSSFLMQHYLQQEVLPDEIVLPFPIHDLKIIEELLYEKQKRKVKIFTPKRGAKTRFLKMAMKNAEEGLHRTQDETASLEASLLNLQETLNLKRYPERIDCIDHSHLGGKDSVSAAVVFFQGKKASNLYRRYIIKTAASHDDYGAIREVLFRRYQKAKEEQSLPDLLIIDGGRGHLNVALSVFSELNIINVDIIGLAKEEGRHDRGLSLEKVFLSESLQPVILKRNSSTLFLLQRIRDEAHRFALSFQTKKRLKSTLHSILEEIPGIGPKKRVKLIRHFGSLKNIQAATVEELKKVKGISRKDAELVHDVLNKSRNPS